MTSPQPTLYVARFPLHRDYVDSGYFTCASPALHVFAMTLTDD